MERRIPRLIDDPPQLLWWEIDDLVAVVGLFGVGIFIDHPGVGLLIGIGLGRLTRRFKIGRPDHYLWHALYWLGWIQGTPSGELRELIE